MGTEFTNILCGIPGLIIWLEIQEGTERMQKKEFSRLRATAACIMRRIIDICDDYSYIEPPQDINDTDESEPAAEEVMKWLFIWLIASLAP